jgi:predicted RecA/RadA family phage recombinase
MGLATLVFEDDSIVPYTASGADVAEGAVVVVGDHIGIATRKIVDGATGTLAIAGIYDMPKQGTVGNDFSDGEVLYWDAANSRVDDTFAAGLPRIGVCVGGATATATTCRVRLTPSLATVPVAGVAAGKRITGGMIALDGSNPTNIATGLTTVESIVLTREAATAPGLNTSVLTVGTISAGTVPIYAWKPTSASDPTLVASTGTENVYWYAIGT